MKVYLTSYEAWSRGYGSMIYSWGIFSTKEKAIEAYNKLFEEDGPKRYWIEEIELDEPAVVNKESYMCDIETNMFLGGYAE